MFLVRKYMTLSLCMKNLRTRDFIVDEFSFSRKLKVGKLHSHQNDRIIKYHKVDGLGQPNSLAV